MRDRPHGRVSRREFIEVCVGLSAPLLLVGCGAGRPGSPSSSAASAQGLEPTPACGDDPDPTPRQTEGPFYTPRSPERASLLELGTLGTRIVLSGYVLSRACEPITHAVLDFWQADDAGVYDNVGYRLRGHQYSDDAGFYRLETVVPGLYPGRTRHFHVKVQPSSGPPLTTQLYFPDEPRNRTDGIFSPALLMDIQNAGGGKSATFNFVV